MIQRKRLKNKSILFVTHSYKDFIKDPIEEMANSFKHVYVLVWHKPIADILGFLNLPMVKIYSFKNKINLKNLPNNVTVLPVNLWYLPFTWWLDRIGNYHFKQALKVINKNDIKFDIVHSHMVWSAGYVGMKLKEKFNVPFVVTGHGRDIYQRPFQSRRRMKNTLDILNAADVVTTVSKLNAGIIKKLTKRKDTKVIVNGIRTNTFYLKDKEDARRKLGLKRDKQYLLYVGNIEPIKGQMLLVNAMKQVVKRHKNVELLLIGSGSDTAKIGKYIKNNKLEDNVRLVGIVPHDKVADWMNASDLFTLTSLGEGNPTVMFESLACGLPFMGTKVGGIGDIINHKTGVLIEPNNIKAIEQGIENGLKTKWKRKDIAEYGKGFDWKVITDQYLEIYNKLVK